MDETDAATESMAFAVDNVGCSFGDSVASPGGLSWRVGNAASKEPRGAKTKGAMGRLSLVIREEESGTPSKTHTFDDSVILDRPDLLWMDRLWQALIVGRPGRLIPMDQNEIAREVKTIFEELGCGKLGVVAYSLRHGGLVGLHEKVSQPRRNPTGAVAQSDQCFEIKSLETPQCDAADRASASRVRQTMRRQPRAPPRRSHRRSIFPWTAHRCFIEIGNCGECKPCGEATWCAGGNLESLVWG